MTLKEKQRIIIDVYPEYEIGYDDTREMAFNEEDVEKAVNELKARIEIGSPSDAKGFRPNEAHPRFYDMTKEEIMSAIDEIFGDFGSFENEKKLWEAELKLRAEQRKMSMEEVEKELNEFVDKTKRAKSKAEKRQGEERPIVRQDIICRNGSAKSLPYPKGSLGSAVKGSEIPSGCSASSKAGREKPKKEKG